MFQTVMYNKKDTPANEKMPRVRITQGAGERIEIQIPERFYTELAAKGRDSMESVHIAMSVTLVALCSARRKP